MMLVAKAALGMGGALVLAGAYTFHEGVIRVDVDEYCAGGSHIHMWVPAAVVPMTLHLVPKHHLREAAERAREFLPLTHALIKELKKFPDADFVEVTDDDQHVQIRTHAGKLQIDVEEPDQNVHLLVPLSTLDDVTSQLELSAPGA
ncbi:MAG: hypothetical protein DMG35_15570 [Acidobacteria bacterium]|nr:MAG: hypothetical protein AUH86_09705 [Acidobacteria bacterium 13_1_40CM_4_58_4]PYT59104.1 MAG: hypothetical protein DMG35_15570 [Acidobacteriota bacterium]